MTNGKFDLEILKMFENADDAMHGVLGALHINS